jgi:hypothetical protein
VIEDEVDYSPDLPSPSAEEITAPTLTKAPPANPPTSVSTAASSYIERDIWGRIVSPRTTPRLRVALDYHHVIHVQHKKWNVVTYEGIPEGNIDQIRRLAAHHEVWILSFAPSPERALEVELSLRDSGILDIIGGRHHLLTGEAIPERVTTIKRKWDKQVNDYVDVEVPGKAKIALRLGVNVLVDDSPEIGAERNRLGVGFIGVALHWREARGESHFGKKVWSLEEAVDLIFDDPDRWATTDR